MAQQVLAQREESCDKQSLLVQLTSREDARSLELRAGQIKQRRCRRDAEPARGDPEAADCEKGRSEAGAEEVHEVKLHRTQGELKYAQDKLYIPRRSRSL
jgi:hypothetical protein